MKNFLFDLYGTLLDIHTDEESEAFWERVASLTGGGAQEVRARYKELCNRQREGLSNEREFDLLPVFETLAIGRGEALAHAFRRESVCTLKPFAGIKEMLGALRERGAKLYLLSNAQACFTCAELEETGLKEYFHGIMLSSEVGYKKPSPAFFKAAFARFSLDPAECLYVGNDLHDDVGGAHSVGMKCAYMETPQSGKYKNPPKPDYQAADVKELKTLLFALTKTASAD